MKLVFFFFSSDTVVAWNTKSSCSECDVKEISIPRPMFTIRERQWPYRSSSPIIVPFAYVTSMLSTLVVYILAIPYRNRQFSTSEFVGHHSQFQLQKTFTSNL